MTPAQKVQLRLSEVRTRLNEIAGLEELDVEIRSEADSLLQVEYGGLRDSSPRSDYGRRRQRHRGRR